MTTPRLRSMRPARNPSAVLLALALVWTPGCSLLFVDGPPSGTPDRPPRCTRHSAAPVVDLTVAAGAGAFAFLALSGCKANCESAAPLWGAISLLAAVPAGASGIYGLVQTNRCNDAWNEWCASRGGCDPDARTPAPGNEVAAHLAALLRTDPEGSRRSGAAARNTLPLGERIDDLARTW